MVSNALKIQTASLLSATQIMVLTCAQTQSAPMTPSKIWMHPYAPAVNVKPIQTASTVFVIRAASALNP